MKLPGKLGLGRALAALALLCTATACDGPTEEEYDDIAAGVGAMVAEGAGGEVEAAADGVHLGRGLTPDGFTELGAGHLTGRRGHLDYEATVTCTDATGATLMSCSAATRAAHLGLSWSGDVEGPRIAASLLRTGDWTLRWLGSDTVSLDGTGTFHVDSEFMALTGMVHRTFLLDWSASYAGVLVRVADGALIGGQVRYDLHAKRTAMRRTRSVDRELEVTADITFLGDGTAQVVLDGDHTYRLQLASGGLVRASP